MASKIDPERDFHEHLITYISVAIYYIWSMSAILGAPSLKKTRTKQVRNKQLKITQKITSEFDFSDFETQMSQIRNACFVENC